MATFKRNVQICVFLIVVLIGACSSSVVHFTSFESDQNPMTEGGRERISTDDPTVRTLAKWSAKRLNGQLISVNSAEEQVVQGMLYFINLTMSDSHKKEHVCFVKIWLRRCMKSVKLLRHNCV